MPQMSPSMWLYISILSILCLYMIMMIIFYQIKFFICKKIKIYNYNKKKWKWMW